MSGSVRFVIIIFNSNTDDGQKTLTFIQAFYEDLIGWGCLVLATMDGIDGFHSCKCKNAAHKLALSTPWPARAPAGGDRGGTRPHLLVNLDADNVVPCTFLPDVECRAPEGVEPTGFWGFRAQGHDSGVTGRVGCTERCFIMSGGYDESLLPTGYQDIDFSKRIEKMGVFIYFRFAVVDAGHSLPNDADEKVARGQAKVQNVAEQYQGTRWGQMNNRNQARSEEKLSRSIWWRNCPEDKPPSEAEAQDVMAQIGFGRRPNMILPGREEPPVVVPGGTEPPRSLRTQRPPKYNPIRILTFGARNLLHTLPQALGIGRTEGRWANWIAKPYKP